MGVGGVHMGQGQLENLKGRRPGLPYRRVGLPSRGCWPSSAQFHGTLSPGRTARRNGHTSQPTGKVSEGP